jgi:hypothetical protein
MLLNSSPLALQETNLGGFTTVTNTKDYQPQGTDLELIILICNFCSLFPIGSPTSRLLTLAAPDTLITLDITHRKHYLVCAVFLASLWLSAVQHRLSISSTLRVALVGQMRRVPLAGLRTSTPCTRIRDRAANLGAKICSRSGGKRSTTRLCSTTGAATLAGRTGHWHAHNLSTGNMR